MLVHSRGEVNKTNTLWVNGGSGAFRKSIWEDLGGFDELYNPFYWEDIDLSYRAKKAGYKIIYVPTAKVYHKVSQSFSGWINPVVLYYSTRNELLLARKHLNFSLFMPLWIPRFVLRIVHYLIATRNVKLARFMLRGFLDFTRGKFGRTLFEV